MANLQVKDASGSSVYVKATGDGSGGTPFIVEHLDTNSAAAAASLSVMDDWDETNRCAVNLIASQVAITGGAGAVAANTPRVTLASDDPAVASLSVLDDWDETNRCAVNLIASQVGIAGGAGAVGATVPRVTLASDDPAVVALQIMDDWDESDRAKVNLIVGQAGIAAGAGAVGATVPRVTLASDDPAVTSLGVLDDWDDTDRAKVVTPADLVDVTLTLDTGGAYTSGDVLADTQSVASAVRVSGGQAKLISITVIDVDDQGEAFDLVFLRANQSLGTENSTPDIDDTEILDVIGFVSIASGDYIDLGGARVATKRDINLILEAVGSSTLYVGAISRGTPTHTASGLRLRLGLEWY